MTPLEFDAHHLWHPYTSVTAPGPTHMAVRTEGVRIYLEDGTAMIDAMSSWWSAIHGHNHPAIIGAVKAQLDQMPHVMFGGLTHPPAVELGQRLLAMLPEGLTRIFYCDSGSVAVEVAMKMAVQYQHSIGQTGRSRFASIRSGYHGDTWKAMSVCDPVTGMHHIFKGALSVQHFVDTPPIAFWQDWVEDPAANGLASLAACLETHGSEIAALILEPVVQGAGGMYFYHPEYLNAARALCNAHGVLLIFDEIATGFGRTGKAFATDHTQITPDIICLGKAITGGTMSFAATVASDNVAEGIGGAEPGVFMHGPTFMGNPLACAAAGASLALLQEGDWQAQVARIEAQMAAELAPARDLPGVADVRVLGAIGVIEMDHTVSAAQAHPISKELGVWLRPFGRNIYTMPPFVTEPDDLSRITGAMVHLAGVL
ncbi:adenosylmethionine--8-amino-7-oxononanoate transaminase [Pseudoruegeria sp. SHC-113]|uniref:adenosylmethionine--8-amino-7-oxononanoate transaminase n=1 Tax=Pseudoruegeria sp. SHC-113 TaxID=2855439 RepID=UPI0021BB2A04|nr:adenosylmethionine--8-amino-7-oxononanoate transaminase [Pseudoruegeria sp. SHC-113]MCT8161410.1 adenosylmethionine--8-amino-7-oxononanoate transaminase [Pseudoruegeria sp. SHC-113]